MKKQAVPALMIMSLMIALAVTPANAQSSSNFVRIRVPFEFTIKDKTLPPGEYIVKRSVSGSPEMLSIRSVDGDSGEYVLTSLDSTLKCNTQPSVSTGVARFTATGKCNLGKHSGEKAAVNAVLNCSFLVLHLLVESTK